MQRKLIMIAGLLFGSLYSGIVNAQQTSTATPDQNPRYRESERRYARSADSLNRQHGTTIQNTYKAYDWYEAKQERRQQNRQWRHEERMNGYYDYTPAWSVYGSYAPYNSWGYGNRWGGYGGRWGGRSRIGVGVGFGW